MVCKTGSDHLYFDKNKQDFVVAIDKVTVVMDGCGSTQFSEIGVSLFGQLLAQEKNIEPGNFVQIVYEIFVKLIKICPEYDNFIYENLCFTILACIETDDEYIVLSCGDGYIIVQQDSVVSTLKLDDGLYPKYYVYNFIDNKESLKEYKDGVDFSILHFSKVEYENVGVATDGFRYVDDLDNLEKSHFYTYLAEGKKGKINMLINRNGNNFKDDIAICF